MLDLETAPTDDREFLDWVFERAVEQIEDCRSIHAETLVAGREHLRQEVEELVQLAR